jgi:hypothetical protein
MKKVFLSLLVFSFSLSVFSMEPVCRLRHNGFLGVWFRSVQNTGSALDPTIPCITCNGPGPLRCIPSNASLGTEPSDMDATDLRIMDEMWDHVDQQLESKEFEGSYQTVVQVEGESFKRVYNVTWALGEKGRGEDKFWREDVQN